MTAESSPDVTAYLEQLESYYADAERNGTDFSNPPRPATPEIAFEVAAEPLTEARVRQIFHEELLALLEHPTVREISSYLTGPSEGINLFGGAQ